MPPPPTRVLIVSAGLLHEGRDPRTIRARRLIDGLGARGLAIDLLGLWLGPDEPPAVPGVGRTHAVEAPIDWAGADSGDPRNAEGLAKWIDRAGSALDAVPADERPDAVYAIGVPVGALAAGAAVAARADLRLVLDLGDPWPAAGAAARAHRAAVLGAADALVTTTPQLAARLEPHLRPGVPMLLAPAGGVRRVRSERPADSPPLVVHLGAINAGRIDPRPSFEALAGLHREGRIELRSHSTGWHPDLDSLPHPHLPLLPHDGAIELLATSSAALVLGNDNRAQLPSKAFEIACTETWALCVSELQADPAVALLAGTGHAVVAGSNTAPAVRAAAEGILEREARGERPHPADRYTWERRIDEIAALIERVIVR